MANNVLPNPLPVTIDSPDPLNVNILSPDPLPVDNGNYGNSSTEYGLNVQRGLVPGVSVNHIFGRNPDIDNNGVFEDIWNGSALYTGFDATVAEVVTVSSSSTDDVNTTGAGAWTLLLSGLDDTFAEISEIIELNGTTAVSSTLSYRRCSIATVLTAGVDAHNVGVLTGGQSITTANIFFVMPETSNKTLICAYTVPFGKLAYVTGGFATIAKKGTASSEVKVSARLQGSVFQVVEWFALDTTGSSYIHRDFEIPLTGVPAGTDIRVQADTDTNNTGIAAGLEILLVEV